MSNIDLDFKEKLEKAQQLNLIAPVEAEKSLRKLLGLDLEDIQKIQVQLELANSLTMQGKHEDAQELYIQIHGQTCKYQFREQEADALMGLATSKRLAGELTGALEAAQTAFEIYQSIHNKIKEARVSNTLGLIYYSLGELEIAQNWFRKTLDLSKETKDDVYVLRAISNIALIDLVRGEFEKAVEYYSKAVDMAKRLNHTHAACTTLNNLAEAQRAMGEYVEAEKNYLQGLQWAKSSKDKRNIGLITSSLATLQVELGELKNAYELFKEAFAIQEELSEPFGRVTVRNELAKFWFVKGQSQEAKRLLEEALEIAKETGVGEAQVETLVLLSEACSALGQIESAYEYLKQASLLARERNSELERTQVLIQKARINMNKLQFADAEMFLEEASWSAKTLGHFKLQLLTEMLQAQQFLHRYQQDFSQNQYLTKAVTHINNSMTLAREKKLIPDYFNALIVRGTLYSLQGDSKNANQVLDEAIKLGKKRGMVIQAQRIQEQSLIISSEQLNHSNIQKLKKVILDLAMEELRRATATYTETGITEEDLTEIFLVSFKVDETGPSIHVGEQIDLSNATQVGELMQIGTIYALSLGQGQEYHKGLFGPLPFGKSNLRSIIYTCHLADPDQIEGRSGGMSYVLFSLVFPSKIGKLFYDRQKLEQIFERQTCVLKDVTVIDEEFLRVLRQKILSEFTKELNWKI